MRFRSRRTPGAVIDPERVYPLDEFSKLLGLSRQNLRTATSRGLRICHIGGKRFVRGQDALDHLARTPEPAAAQRRRRA